MSDVVSRDLLTVPAEDPAAFAAMTDRAWSDDDLRRRTTAAGLEYAIRARTEQDFYQRLIDRISDWYA